MANIEMTTPDFPPLLIDESVDPVLDVPELVPFNQAPRIVEQKPVEHVPPLTIIERDFPRIAAAIKLMWGNRELDDYLDRLIVSDREGRVGFKLAVFEALLKLTQQHKVLFNFQREEDAVSHDPFNRRAYWAGESHRKAG